ncbi:hypothetical protein QMK33_22735 [Hymenobacter sp. H14-R3]|uniref:hypothetical protein n=1 Tax=Hymenobacter sp. H14-R3 TaxID=3046308 RepID=UPI0024BA25F9|nr:hypothetical protein [Hymenobacter sp. H14-R3]MDJ0367968.1 hypothetical protein [Hymenobacter sp. H14-R3]
MIKFYFKWLIVLFGLYGVTLQRLSARPIEQALVNCPILFSKIVGPRVLSTTTQYTLASVYDGGQINTDNISWSVSPASAVYIISGTTSPTLLLAPIGCDSVKATITVSYLTSGCSARKANASLDVTVIDKNAASNSIPVISGTYKCVTCDNTGSKTLLLDGSTNLVSKYGTYQIDLTSNTSNDEFTSWDKFEGAGATLQIRPNTQNRSATIVLTPSAGLAALAVNVQSGNCGKSRIRQAFRFATSNPTSWLVSMDPVLHEVIIEPIDVPEPTPAPSPYPPNPTSSALAYSATLYDSHSTPVRDTQSTAHKVVFDVRSLPAGMYYLRILGKNTFKSQQIVIN